jgi:hypothetical protein
VSVTVIKDLAKAVLEQERQKPAQRKDEATQGPDNADPPAAPEAGSTQQDSSKGDK